MAGRREAATWQDSGCRRSSRRPGLRLGYLLGAAGAFSAVLAAITGFFPLLPLGVAGIGAGNIGAGNAANMATRYAGPVVRLTPGGREHVGGPSG